MKKILLFLFIIVLIPTIILSIFITEEEIEFKFSTNMFIRVKRTSGEIQNIPFEEYIVGVLAGEMPVNFHREALKAQAVASRSYAMKKMKQNYDNEYDVVDTVLNQVYLDNDQKKEKWGTNFEKNLNIMKLVVFETSGEFLEYDGIVIEALYFSTGNGFTENNEDVFGSYRPYLKSVESKWDELHPSFMETKIIPIGAFCKELELSDCNNLNINITETSKTGRIKNISINGKSFKGTEVRSKLSLRSTHFSITRANNNLIITTRGFGHGVGMSQHGANGMAQDGYTYREILKHYYSGVNIQRL